MASSTTGSLDHHGGGFSFTPPSFITSFTDLLSSAGDHHMLGSSDADHRSPRFRGNGGVPKFKSAQPPSLQSPLPMSPSSYFASIPAGLSPAELLDSPVLLTSAAHHNLLLSPTTGAIPAAQYRSFDWKHAADVIAAASQQQQQQDTKASSFSSDFSFHSNNNNNNGSSFPAASFAAKEEEQEQVEVEAASNYKVAAAAGAAANSNNNNGSSSKLEDGYNWRKYGQKQVKGSENPRSYYKCTHPSCSMKKKVERSLADGRVTQIVYKGAHNHPKPVSTRRNTSSSGAAASSAAAAAADEQHSGLSGGGGGVATPENSSVTFGDDAASHRSDGDEPDAKRWKGQEQDGGDNEGISSGSGSGGSANKPVREPRLVVQTLSDIDILDDGFRWRKYGQKVVKGNPNPRSYYKCTTVGCPVRKHVERAGHDARAVITTYEGKHNHDVPVGRGARAPVAAPAAAVADHPLPQGHNNHHPYTLEMLSNNNSGYGASTFQQQQRVMTTKDEPRDDLFVDSLLLC